MHWEIKVFMRLTLLRYFIFAVVQNQTHDISEVCLCIKNFFTPPEPVFTLIGNVGSRPRSTITLLGFLKLLSFLGLSLLLTI